MRPHDRCRDPRRISFLFREARAQGTAQLVARSGKRPDPAVHQCRHGPVQGVLPGNGVRRLEAGRHGAAVPPREREAQRSGERGVHGAPSHALRDAGKFLLRGLLQEGRDLLRMGLPDARDGDRRRTDDGFRVPGGRRGVRHLAQDDGAARLPHRPVRREGQLLGDGAHGTLRPVLRDHLRPGGGNGVRAPLVRRGLRLRPVPRDLEPRVHAVQPGGGRQQGSPPEAEHRHGDGSGAAGGRGPGGQEQLRYRPVPQDHRGDRAPERRGVREIPRPGCRHPGDRRPRPRDGVPDRRRRPPRQRGEGVRPAQDHAPRPAPREEAGVCRAVSAPGGGRRRPGFFFRLSRTGEERILYRHGGPERGEALSRNARRGSAHGGGGVRADREGGRRRLRRRRRVQALRHVRVPRRPDGGPVQGAWGDARHRGVRERDGKAARPVPRGLEGGRGGRLRRGHGRARPGRGLRRVRRIRPSRGGGEGGRPVPGRGTGHVGGGGRGGRPGDGRHPLLRGIRRTGRRHGGRDGKGVSSRGHGHPAAGGGPGPSPGEGGRGKSGRGDDGGAAGGFRAPAADPGEPHRHPPPAGGLAQGGGGHIKQAGSYVGPDKLRFDFTHFEAGPRTLSGRWRMPSTTPSSPTGR